MAVKYECDRCRALFGRRDAMERIDMRGADVDTFFTWARRSVDLCKACVADMEAFIAGRGLAAQD